MFATFFNFSLYLIYNNYKGKFIFETKKTEKIDELSIATLKSLIIDETNEAKSGHPGMALGSSPLVYALFTRYINVNPKDPSWFNRDRFVLSAGHASSLLYSLFHLCGYDISTAKNLVQPLFLFLGLAKQMVKNLTKAIHSLFQKIIR